MYIIYTSLVLWGLWWTEKTRWCLQRMIRIEKSYTLGMHWRAAAIQSGFSTVKHDQCQKRKKTIDTKKRNKSAQESKGLAVIPYVEGLSETAERIFRKYGINTAIKPHRTLRQLLVHPKNLRTHSRANWRMCVQDSMPQLRLYIYWRDWQKLWEETRGTQKRSRID